MQFLTECRLNLVRKALQSPSPGATVASIASRCGFFHQGRFAKLYRERFGESHSQTMRQA
jgi:transcriptional regulator GlxA family with amidase domain